MKRKLKKKHTDSVGYSRGVKIAMTLPFYRQKRFWIVLAAALVVLALLLTLLISVLTTAPAVYEYEGATLREDAYRYWFACYKYAYLVRYKALGISDTPEGWQQTDKDGRTYEEVFYEMIDDEIRLRFIAASLFDSEGYRLSDSDYEEIDQLIAEFSEEIYGEEGFDLLSEQYDIGENAVKQTALYEQKYLAFYRALFSDPSMVYDIRYRDALAQFYEKYYYRYNMIYVTAENVDRFEAQLASHAGLASITDLGALTGRISEETFTKLEADYSESENKVTSGNYPRGIYLYGGASYESAFSEELFMAFKEADEIGKIVKKRDIDGGGYYYVMRYALDKEPYLSEDEKMQYVFADLPEYASSYLYREMLKKELDKIVSHGVAEGYTVASTDACQDYNVVRLLGGT